MKHYFNPSLRDIGKSFLSLQVSKASVATHNQKSQKALFDNLCLWIATNLLRYALQILAMTNPTPSLRANAVSVAIYNKMWIATKILMDFLAMTEQRQTNE